MARLILKWRYFTKTTHKKRYVKYVATRDGVVKINEDWRKEKSTQQQEKLIKDLLKDYPELESTQEYLNHLSSLTKGSANDFINKVFDEYIDTMTDEKKYIEYISKRPRVEKHGEHGLFSKQGEDVNLDKVLNEISNHQGLVFTTIISLKREDAEAFGYNNAKKWQGLLTQKEIDIAKSMSIDPKELNWYAAFHDEGYHPHIHLVTYSSGKKPYTTQKQLDNLKRSIAKEVFALDLYNVYVNKDQKKKDLKVEAEKAIDNLLHSISNRSYSNEKVENLIAELLKTLNASSGKKVYGYLPPKAKNLVDGIIDELSSVDEIKKLYDLWYEQKEKTIQIYRDEMPNRIPLVSNNEFKFLKNMVIREVLKLNYNSDLKNVNQRNQKQKVIASGKQNNPNIALMSSNLIARLIWAFKVQMNFDEDEKYQIDKKLLNKINEKRQAQGQKMS